MSVTVRGKAKIDWKPAYTLTMASPDGVSFSADGATHDLTATLTRTSDGTLISNRTIGLATSPVGRVGDGLRATTDVNGKATFRVSNTDAEVIAYTGSLIPDPPTSDPTITGSINLYWSTTGFTPIFLFQCSMSSSTPGPSVGSPATITTNGTSAVDLGVGFVATAFPSGSTAAFHTSPGGGPGEGEVKSFVDTVFGEGVATLVATSAVPGTWNYTVTFTAPSPFGSGPNSGSPQPIVWS